MRWRDESESSVSSACCAGAQRRAVTSCAPTGAGEGGGTMPPLMDTGSTRSVSSACGAGARLSDEAVHSLFEEGGCTKLRELNLNLNTDLAGACFRQHNHTNLLTLSLRDCKSLDIMGMASCLYSFPRILNLDVTGCTM